MTGDTFLAMMQNNALCHVPVGRVTSQMVHHFTYPAVLLLFCTGNFLVVRQEEGGRIPAPPRFADLTPFRVLLLEVPKRQCLSWKVQNVNELCDGIFRIAESVTNETFVDTSPETEYRLEVCRATDGARIDICWAHKELCQVQCFEIYRFIEYALWLKI
jgi:hypothetical protein